VAAYLRTVVRDTDAIGRWGGEEFLAILPDTDEGDATVLAERMRVVVESAQMLEVPGLRVTISLGVAGLRAVAGQEAANWGELLRRADHALYRAKEAGRNQVVESRPHGVETVTL
jgi:diguanylate cyclase (GGDEF)-like protein